MYITSCINTTRIYFFCVEHKLFNLNNSIFITGIHGAVRILLSYILYGITNTYTFFYKTQIADYFIFNNRNIVKIFFYFGRYYCLYTYLCYGISFFVKNKIGVSSMPKRQTKYIVLRSAHIDKKSREAFKYTVLKKLKTVPVFINYLYLCKLQNMMPIGIGCRIHYKQKIFI